MVSQLLNTLFVTKPRAYLRLDHDTLWVEVEKQRLLQVPLMTLGSIVCFGDIMITPSLIHRCAEDGRSIVLLTSHGRFRARIEGPTTGNVLLRRAQYHALENPVRTLEIARMMVAGKIVNSRNVLLRAARDSRDADDQFILERTARGLRDVLQRGKDRTDLDGLRGDEGDAARSYFHAFPAMITANRDVFGFSDRSRRPPQDPMNAILSFLYTLVRADCVAALEGVGLDPQAGFLHALRPGRPALALDLMEEFRAPIADRIALTLVNRRELKANDFEWFEGGGVHLNDAGRKTVILAYQKRKEVEVDHKIVKGRVPIGLVPHVQARLLARTIRGEIELYPPFVARG